MLGLIRHILRRAARALAGRQARAAALGELQRLDACMLRDVGLSHRAAAEWAQAHRRAGP